MFKKTHKWTRYLAPIVSCVVCLACEPSPPDLDPPVTFASNGISFEHPNNWFITSSPEVNTIGDYKVQTVLIKNPQQAPILLIVQNLQFDKSIDELMTMLSQRVVEGVADSWMGKTGAFVYGNEIRRESAERDIAGSKVSGLRTLTEVKEFKMEGNAVAEIYTLASPDASSWVLVWIAADEIESWQSAEPGYIHILESLRIEAWPNVP